MSDNIPLWWNFLVTMGLVLVCLQIGIVLRKRDQRSAKARLEVSGVMVGAAMGLLSFMLAFTFNGASNRHETRKMLVIEEANAIETTWLRAGLLGAPHSVAMRALLRDYVDVRLKVGMRELDVTEGIRQADTLHDAMWAVAEEAGRRDTGSIATGLFIQSLNDVIDLHLTRLTVGIRNRVPSTIWVTLYLLLLAGMIMMGIQIGQGEARHFGIELALAATFALVFFLIADLDRPQEGTLRVSQQAMADLQTKLHAR